MTGKHETIQYLKQIQALTEDMLDYQAVDVDAAYARVQKRIGKSRTRQPWRRFVSRIAVALLLPLLLSSLLFAYLYVDQRNQLAEASYREVSSAPGTVTRIQLPDHSTVWLNAESTLRYPAVFTGQAREVILSGEGYFTVESDPEHPFYVATTDGLKVKAYGTQFNVNAYVDEPVIEATLAQGKIDVMQAGQTVRLEPHKLAVFHKATGRFTVSPVSLDEKTGWKDGRLVFRNTPLEEVLKKISKRYNTDIVLHKKDNKQYKYRATFTTETVEQILNYLSLTIPVEWSVTAPEQIEDQTFTRRRIDVYQQ